MNYLYLRKFNAFNFIMIGVGVMINSTNRKNIIKKLKVVYSIILKNELFIFKIIISI